MIEKQRMWIICSVVEFMNNFLFHYLTYRKQLIGLLLRNINTKYL